MWNFNYVGVGASDPRVFQGPTVYGRRRFKRKRKFNDAEDLSTISLRDFVLQSTAVPPLSARDVFQDAQWMPETSDSTEPYIYSFSLYMHTCDKVRFIN